MYYRNVTELNILADISNLKELFLFKLYPSHKSPYIIRRQIIVFMNDLKILIRRHDVHDDDDNDVADVYDDNDYDVNDAGDASDDSDAGDADELMTIQKEKINV
jgi:hypothetical protein